MDNQEYKLWLCELASDNDYDYSEQDIKHIELEILIKAMWAINRKDGTDWNIKMDQEDVTVYVWNSHSWDCAKSCDYEAYENSEQKALDQALRYIYSETS